MPEATILLKIAAISEGVPLSQLNLRIFAGGRELGTEVALPVDWQKVAIDDSRALSRCGRRHESPQGESAGNAGRESVIPAAGPQAAV
jgi:hypothetical protein